MKFTRASWRHHAELHLQLHPGPEAAPSDQRLTIRSDVETLLQHVLECSRSSLYAWPEKALEVQQIETLATLLNRRALGEPMAYLLGHAQFHARDFQVNSSVLVPRDDTETLVNLALEYLRNWPESPPGVKPSGGLAAQHVNKPVILDIGTGSGAIAITIAAECGVQVIATDLSPAALRLASANADRHAPGRVSLIQADWLTVFADNSANMILSNPPYIAELDPNLPQLSHEPELALVSGPRGLDAIQQIISHAVRVGVSGCPVMLEHGHEQGSAVRELMRQARLVSIRTKFDLAGHERVTLGHVAT